MCENAFNFSGRKLIEESVKEDNTLVREKSVKVSVGMGRAGATIDDKNLGERERESRGKGDNFLFKLAFGKRGKGIEMRIDPNGFNGENKKRKNEEECPNVEIKVSSAPIENCNNAAQNKRQKYHGQTQALQDIQPKCALRRFIKTKAFLQHKREIPLRGNSLYCCHSDNNHAQRYGLDYFPAQFTFRSDRISQCDFCHLSAPV